MGRPKELMQAGGIGVVLATPPQTPRPGWAGCTCSESRKPREASSRITPWYGRAAISPAD
ncbi:hypothetical protein [Streptomyces sp. 11x1]|uniref:hypothetical protein n=1 Tax=Streptomyces sp. 11x1 TaxID=3038642 RepID=UPI002930527A|nr:hypothetical protein [Streptomyces sp. 11x1]WNZ14692.1 hypothetical protein P8T65_33920 [Streptomyces sp. 11x1]